MSLLPKRVFVTDYQGLCNRLEAMTMAFAVQQRFGHEVCLNWPQLDALEVDGTATRSPGLLGRLSVRRLHSCTRAEFDELGRWRNILLRGPEGPAEVLDPLYLPTARRVRLRPAFTRVLDDAFAPHAGRPVVGVHIRRGDFDLHDEDIYDVNAGHRSPAVPTWWYEWMMARLVARQPDSVFLLACTGDSDEFLALKKNFDVFTVNASAAYPILREGHESHGHPVADLFALSRCSLLLATPRSTFSSYAAFALGEPATCLVAARRMSRQAPGYGIVRLYGQRAPAWFAACRDGVGCETGDDANLPEVLPYGAAVAAA